MAPKQALGTLCAIAVLGVFPALAHHSLEAEYDPNHVITLKGTITKVDWSNPHVHFLVDVRDGPTLAIWEVEMGSPNAQILSGWKIDTFRPGDRVEVSLYPARDGSKLGFARKMNRASR